MNSRFSVYCKNARLHTEDRLAELLGELNQCQWDVVLFSETRRNSEHCKLAGGHKLHASSQQTVAAGVAILVNRHLLHGVRRVQVISDRLMFLDLHIGTRICRLISIYMPHAGYPHDDLRKMYDQLHWVLAEAQKMRYVSVIGGDFNTQWNVGRRGDMIREFSHMFGLCLANHEHLPATWTFRSSTGIKRQLDFILFSSELCCESAGAVDVLDLGSDHRAVHCNLYMRARCFKRFWEPLRVPRGWMPNNQQQYHANLQMRLSNQQPNTIMELERLVHSAAVSSMKCEQSRLVEPWEQDVFQHLLQQRKSSRDATERRALSKLIRKKLRSFQRQKQNQKITTTLEQFQDFGRLDALFHDPIKTFDMPATSRPSPEAFTECLSEIFTSSDVHVEACQSNIGFSTIPPFQLSELRQALRHMRNRRSGDDAGLVLEMFKLGCTELHECLLDIYNSMLLEESLEPSWQHTLFKMLPKPGDSTQASNWRPIAVLKITYKIFAKLLDARIHCVLESAQCADQVGFRSKLGIDHAFAVLETMIGKSIEWDTPLWCASLDLRKAFDKIEHRSLFEALHAQGVPQCYISLLTTLYRSQTGQVQAGRKFSIQRGVKQGDVLSPALFNAGLELALARWKCNLSSHGLHVGGTERLTNIRYADDILLYAKSLEELVFMMEWLVHELTKVGLQLSSAKTKIFTTQALTKPLFVEVGGEMVEVLMCDQTHKYLGRRLCGSLARRHVVEFNHRVQLAWNKFHRHRRVLVNKHVSIKLRMKFLDAVVTPTILFGLHTLALTGVQLSKLDSIQRRMLRSMVGWTRLQDESWHDTMSRMKIRVAKALHQHPIETWTRRLARCQHSFASRVAQTNGWVTRVVTWNPESNWRDNFSLAPKRRQGRPLTRWDDKMRSFCKLKFPDTQCWMYVAASSAWKRKADDFVNEFVQVVQ